MYLKFKFILTCLLLINSLKPEESKRRINQKRLLCSLVSISSTVTKELTDRLHLRDEFASKFL